MKIAFSTNNEKTVSGHLGRAKYYKVVEIKDDKIINEEIIEKPVHKQGEHSNQNTKIGLSMPNEFKEGGQGFREFSHNDMVNIIKDCKYVITKSMGQGAIQSFINANIKPIITDIKEIDEAIQAFINGELKNLNEENINN